MIFILFADGRVPELSFLLTMKTMVVSNRTHSLTYFKLEIRNLIILALFIVKLRITMGWIQFLLHPLCVRGQAPCPWMCSQLLQDFRMPRDTWTFNKWFWDQRNQGLNRRILYTPPDLLRVLPRLLRLWVMSYRSLGLVFLTNLQVNGRNLYPSRAPEGWVMMNWRSL